MDILFSLFPVVLPGGWQQGWAFSVFLLSLTLLWQCDCGDCLGAQIVLASAFWALLWYFALALLSNILFLGGFMVRTRCPSVSEFWLDFSFPLGLFVGRTSFSQCHSLLLPLSVTVVPFFCACVVSLSCEYGCHALVLGFFTGVFLPSLSPWSVWSWCACVFSES